ncbi:hypothetical protein DMX12_09195 [Pseudomonas sp. MB-090624]|nr:hypothetical protein DMX12_09195 [Pseudomonas sp. MB-090624]
MQMVLLIMLLPPIVSLQKPVSSAPTMESMPTTKIYDVYFPFATSLKSQMTTTLPTQYYLQAPPQNIESMKYYQRSLTLDDHMPTR